MKTAENYKLDCAVYTWFVQQRRKGKPISRPIICEKALIMNKNLGGDPQFKATTGWLQKFKLRHGIRQLDISGKKLSANFESVDNFKKQFLLIIKEKGYNIDSIYNADETGLNWRALPKKL